MDKRYINALFNFIIYLNSNIKGFNFGLGV